MRTLAILVAMSGVAHAGSDEVTCETADRSVVLTGSTVRFSWGKQSADGIEVPVNLMPDNALNEEAPNLVLAVPISNAKVKARSREHMRVVHKDGTSCYGRERYVDEYTQKFVLTGVGGTTLHEVLGDHKIKGRTRDGYLVAQFTCQHEVVTTAGGCIPEEDDDYEMVPF